MKKSDGGYHRPELKASASKIVDDGGYHRPDMKKNGDSDGGYHRPELLSIEQNKYINYIYILTYYTPFAFLILSIVSFYLFYKSKYESIYIDLDNIASFSFITIVLLLALAYLLQNFHKKKFDFGFKISLVGLFSLNLFNIVTNHTSLEYSHSYGYISSLFVGLVIVSHRWKK